MREAIDFAARDSMMAARRFDGTQLSPIDPLLQGGITDAQHLSRNPQLQQFHGTSLYANCDNFC